MDPNGPLDPEQTPFEMIFTQLLDRIHLPRDAYLASFRMVSGSVEHMKSEITGPPYMVGMHSSLQQLNQILDSRIHGY